MVGGGGGTGGAPYVLEPGEGCREAAAAVVAD